MPLCTEGLGEDPKVRRASQSLLSLSKPEGELLSPGSLAVLGKHALRKGNAQNTRDGWQAAGSEVLAVCINTL